MEQKDFEKRLEECSSDLEIARLADEVFEEILDGMDISIGKKYIAELLDRGLDPAIQIVDDENDDWICINSLAYLYDDEELEIAKMIFDKCGVPTEFFSFVGMKVDYNYYACPYVVKLYLLASAYLWETEETYIEMNENLYEEMFDGSYCYTSLRPEHTKLSLTPDIFKKIEKYDFSVEMLEQQVGKCRWTIRIFDKEKKIEVARYV